MGAAYHLYQCLELTKDADIEQIKRAYRALAKKYHPDAHPNQAEYEERFREISEAYAILSDPDKRSVYDEEQARQPDNKKQNSTRPPDMATDQVDFEQIHKSFEGFFGFHPESKEITREDKIYKKEQNLMNTSDMFAKFMGIKR